MVCFGDKRLTKATRTREGAENDEYRCELGHGFSVDWRRGPPDEPGWPLPEDLVKALHLTRQEASSDDLLEALTRIMIAEPKKIDAVLVAADHLEELGDPRAEYLRGQVALRELSANSTTAEARREKHRVLRAIYPAGQPSWLARLEQAGVFEQNLTDFPSAWWGQSLPGRPSRGTYGQHSAAKVAAIPGHNLRGDLGWLRDTPREPASFAEVAEAAGWRALLSRLKARAFHVPDVLVLLMQSEELQGLIPSSTGNYFIEASEIQTERLQRLDDGVAFLPFYSDQQDVVRWGVWISQRGEPYAPVLSAQIDWSGVAAGDGAQTVRYTSFELAAPSVESFLYRTWIEDRIWFATRGTTTRELLDFEDAYLAAYSRDAAR